MEMEYVWNSGNIEHIAKHGIEPRDAEYVANNAQPPYPQMIGEDKRLVVGRLRNGQYIQVIYVPSRLVPGAVYVMHSRALTDREKRKFRRRTR
jgi:uncharacterized DUF497 family protein